MKRLILASLAVSLGVTALAAAAGTWLIRNELALRPPIAVVDYSPIANAIALGVPLDQIQPYLRETKRRAQAYQAAGFVVINAASIDAAPVDVFVPPLDDLPEAWRESASAAPKISPSSDFEGDGSLP
ncbi:MAG: hypothetical protein R3F54_23490 [Alphaproteobacteria bacterium]